MSEIVLKTGDPITVALRWSSDKIGRDRLVHTVVHSTVFVNADGNLYAFGSGCVNGFTANLDDRPAHRFASCGVTWLRGHVPLDGPEAAKLLRLSMAIDESATRGKG